MTLVSWHGSPGAKVVQIKYTYLGPRNAFVNIGATVDGVAVEGNALLESTMVNYTQQAPLPMNLYTGSTVVLKLLNYDGDEVLIEGVDVFELEPDSSVATT